MKAGYSIRARLFLGAALVLVAFIAGAGFAVHRAHADSVRSAHYSRLQGTIYLLLARAEVNSAGVLEMPPDVGEPRLGLPASGLYAGIYNVRRKELWRSSSTLGVAPPFPREQQPGDWRFGEIDGAWLAASYAVNWDAGRSKAPLVVSVLEDKAAFDREVAVFSRTLWAWLGGAGALLLVAQVLLLQWGLRPLRSVAREIGRIESGEQSSIEGRYPNEISGLTDGLNALIQQERVRQTRYKEALSFLAHSLKTPLAVLRSALHEPRDLPAAVAEQVSRMDDIVQHQLGRARAGGAARFAPPVAVAPVLQRIRDALVKVYAERKLAFDVECEAGLHWRIDEGDLFEMLGNVMDNAAKWARGRVRVGVKRDARCLRIVVDDDGAGFSDTESVLLLHVRMDERVPGHGVGLAVVNDLVASHHGKLTLSRGELGGARVAIELPAA